MRIFVGQYGQAGNLTIIAVEEAVIIDVHPPWEKDLNLPLHLNMDEDPDLVAIFAPDPHQFIDATVACLGVTDDLLQLLVEEFMWTPPIHISLDMRKEEREKLGKVLLQNLFPR
jgi:hypothetical protein